MSQLEAIDGSNWEAFVAAPLSVLVLGKSDCAACLAWAEELDKFLATSALASEVADVRFGKMVLDKPGLASFKRANSWLSEIDVLPFNVIYQAGERSKSFAGGGLDRLLNRLKRLRDDAES